MADSVILAVIGLVVSWFLVGIIRRLALRHELMDIPNERSSHVQPTPRGGGLAIVIVVVVGMAVVGVLQGWFSVSGVLIAYLVGAVATAVVSWFDDLRGLSNRVRFAVHVGAAVLLMSMCGSIDRVFLPVWGEVAVWGWVAIPATLFWMVGLTNAYNFMDGIDGIAGSQAVVAGAGWFAIAHIAGEGVTDTAAIGTTAIGTSIAGTLGVLIAVASLGFLAHNWPPAKIFMGDVGSAFLGYSFAAALLIAGTENPRLVLPGVLLVWPFVFDTALTMARRARAGENIFTAHRSHLYQRLNIAGFSHQWVTLLYGALALLGAAAAYFVGFESPAASLGAIGVIFAAGAGLVLFVQSQQVRAGN